MDIVDIDVTKLITLGDNLLTISNNLNSYFMNFEEYVTKLQRDDIWRGSSATSFRVLSEKDVAQYKEYSKSIEDLGRALKTEAEALEEEIKALKEY